MNTFEQKFKIEITKSLPLTLQNLINFGAEKYLFLSNQ